MNLPISEDRLPDDLISTNEAARLARCSLVSVYRWIRLRKVRAWKRVGRLLVSRADVLVLFEQRASIERWENQVSPRRRQSDKEQARRDLERMGL